MSKSLENAIISLYFDINLQESPSNILDNSFLNQQNPLILITHISDSYRNLREQINQSKNLKEILGKTESALSDQIKLNHELTQTNETLKQKYNELKTSKKELMEDFQEVEEQKDLLSTELIQVNSKLKELQEENEKIIINLSQTKYELNNLKQKLKKSKSIKNLFGKKHHQLIGYVEEEEISSNNPMCKSLTNMKSMLNEAKPKTKKKKLLHIGLPMSKFTPHPAIHQKKVINVSEGYFNENETSAVMKPKLK